MKSDEEKLELFLRQFRPRRPRPLPPVRMPRRVVWASGAAAALLLVVLAGLTVRRAEPPADVALGGQGEMRSTAAAAIAAHVVNWDVEALDRMLTEMSPGVLPDVERRDGSLYVLARE